MRVDSGIKEQSLMWVRLPVGRLSWFILCSLRMRDKSCGLFPWGNSGRNHLPWSTSLKICTWSVNCEGTNHLVTRRAIQDPILHSIQETKYIVHSERFHDLLNASSNLISNTSPRILFPSIKICHTTIPKFFQIFVKLLTHVPYMNT